MTAKWPTADWQLQAAHLKERTFGWAWASTAFDVRESHDLAHERIETRDKEMDNFFPVLAPAIVTVSA